MKTFIRNLSWSGRSRCFVAAGTCDWLGDSGGRAAGEIEHDAAAVGPAALRAQRRKCRLQEAKKKKAEREQSTGPYNPSADNVGSKKAKK